jgi:hypothetical protein
MDSRSVIARHSPARAALMRVGVEFIAENGGGAGVRLRRQPRV